MIQNHLSPLEVVLPFYTMETLYKSISRVTRFFSSPSHNCAIGRAALFAIAFAILLVILLRFAHYHSSPDFTRYDAGPERKEAFFSYFLPLIEEQNRELLEVREELVALNINQHPAYQDFRETRAELRDEKDIITGLDLVGKLQRYSERGHEYVQELSSMIRFNELTEFDQAVFQGV